VASSGHVLFAWASYSDGVFGAEFGVYLYLPGGLILSRQTYSFTRGGLVGLGLEDRSELLVIIKKMLFGIFELGLAYLGYGVVRVLIGHIAASLIGAGLAFGFISRHLDVSQVLADIPADFPRRELFSYNGLSIVLILRTASLITLIFSCFGQSPGANRPDTSRGTRRR